MEQVLSAVKNYLDITWDDPDSDKKLSGIIERGEKYIDDIAGYPQDYTDETTQAFALLLEYVRYARAGALDQFQINYKHELLHLQITERANQYGDGEDDTNIQ